MPLKRGSLYRYNYLWAREQDRNEISGRKARPVCLVMRSEASPASLFLFPVTSKAPLKGTLAVEVPESECRRANLAQPSWIVVEEYNRADEDELYDFESLNPLGAFSSAFMKQIGRAIGAASDSRRLRAVHRA